MSQTAAPIGGSEESRPSQSLLTFLTVLSGVTDELERARVTATGLGSLLPCNLSGLALLDQSESSWNLVVQKGTKHVGEIQTKRILAELEPFFQEAFRKPPVVIVTSGGETTDGRVPPSIEELGVQHLVMAPLMTLRSRLGVLFAGWEEREHCSPDYEMILSTLAEHSAISIENTRFHESLKQSSARLQDLVEEHTENLRQSEQRQKALLEIGNAIISHLDRQSLFNAIAQALEKVVSFDRASLALLDSETDIVKTYARWGTLPRKALVPVGTEYPREGSHLEYVLDEKRPLIRRDMKTEALVGLEKRALQEGIRSYIAVPLIAEGKAIGALFVGSLAPNHYSEDNASFLMEMGEQVVLAVENMLAYEKIAQLKAQLEQENVYLQEEMKLHHGFEEVIGQCPAIEKVLKAVESVAPTDATVLLTGETGTGKELFARATHNLSPRKSKTLVKVNCAALPAGLIESELFGHEKGAFTGAISRKIGRFELAHRGTIFLDEIGDLPLELQAKLLRVLQEGEFERLGGSQTIKVDVRVIAATNRAMDKAIEDGKFREDLYYRLSVFPIEIPPLRERTEDIPALVSHFVMKYGLKLGKRAKSISKTTSNTLSAYPWPGNIRELENVIERGMILSQGDRLDLGAWPPAPIKSSTSPGESRVSTLEELEREHIASVLQLTGWRVSGEKGAAKLLGIKSTTLHSRMSKLGIARKS